MYRLHGFFTQNSMKPLYVLEALEVEYDYVFVDLMQRENLSDDFKQKTPIRKVPVLEHDGEFLFESGPICRYVASLEKSPLYPADKLHRARVDQWMTYFTCHPGRQLTEIYFQKIIKPVAGLGETDEAACEQAVRFIQQQLKLLEQHFADTSWLANDTFSIADVFALGYMDQVAQVGFSLQEFPRVSAWLERLNSLDSTARARARVKDHVPAALAG